MSGIPLIIQLFISHTFKMTFGSSFFLNMEGCSPDLLNMK